MNCERFETLLPDYLAGTLKHEDEDRFEDHMEQCVRCREAVALWNKLAELPQEQPSPALRARFESMLEAHQQAHSEARDLLPRHSLLPFLAGGGWMRIAASAALAMVLLAVGFAAGRYPGDDRSKESREEMVAMREELRGMRQLVVLAMLQQQESASQRLQAVAMGSQSAQMDPQVLAALVQTLHSDSSVDVRLAALNALARHSSQPTVREGLLDALQPRQSPLVQVALIDLLVEMRDRSAVPQLQKVSRDASLNPTVRQRAELAIRQLN
jgi:anti-sigma-K factor RskA